MQRVLITGMSATGKSTLVRSLAARGHKAVDLDDPAWSEYVEVRDSSEPPWQDWVWREDRVSRLLESDDAPILFVSGCASNQGQFHARFDHIVLLSAPVEVMLGRLATRTTNSFGKRPEERAKILRDRNAVEPRLRRVATLEIDTSAPLEDVVQRVLALIEPAP